MSGNNPKSFKRKGGIVIMKKYQFSIVGNVTLLFTTLLLNSCATSYLHASYKKLDQPTEDVRIICVICIAYIGQWKKPDQFRFLPSGKDGGLDIGGVE